jgi:hypothetical protein
LKTPWQAGETMKKVALECSKCGSKRHGAFPAEAFQRDPVGCGSKELAPSLITGGIIAAAAWVNAACINKTQAKKAARLGAAFLH